jgi:hypothetical protein
VNVNGRIDSSSEADKVELSPADRRFTLFIPPGTRFSKPGF